MWDKHRQVRKDSRKRAMRAAKARAAQRGGGAQPTEPEPEPEPVEEPSGPGDPAPEPEETSDPAPPRDPAGSLAWTGLVLLTLILGGFIGAVFFMLG